MAVSVAKRVVDNFALNRQSFPNSQKSRKILEAEPKKHAFASHGDFRGYLYEATILSMPVCSGMHQNGRTKGVSGFKPQFEVLNYRFHRKNSANFETLLFRRKTPTCIAICGKISSKTAYLAKMR